MAKAEMAVSRRMRDPLVSRLMFNLIHLLSFALGPSELIANFRNGSLIYP